MSDSDQETLLIAPAGNGMRDGETQRANHCPVTNWFQNALQISFCCSKDARFRAGGQKQLYFVHSVFICPFCLFVCLFLCFFASCFRTGWISIPSEQSILSKMNWDTLFWLRAWGWNLQIAFGNVFHRNSLPMRRAAFCVFKWTNRKTKSTHMYHFDTHWVCTQWVCIVSTLIVIPKSLYLINHVYSLVIPFDGSQVTRLWTNSFQIELTERRKASLFCGATIGYVAFCCVPFLLFGAAAWSSHPL